MFLHCFCIKDEKAGSFLRPFFAVSAAEAVRSVTSLARQPDSLMFQFPSDFSLWRIGSFHQNIGALDCPEGGPEHVCNVQTLKEVNNV